MTKENLKTEYCNEYGYEVFNKYNNSNYTKFLEDKIIAFEKQLSIHGVVKSLPTEQCVRDWWREGTGDEHFWKHETDWSNEQVFREIYQALTYFINRWQ